MPSTVDDIVDWMETVVAEACDLAQALEAEFTPDQLLYHLERMRMLVKADPRFDLQIA